MLDERTKHVALWGAALSLCALVGYVYYARPSARLQHDYLVANGYRVRQLSFELRLAMRTMDQEPPAGAQQSLKWLADADAEALRFEGADRSGLIVRDSLGWPIQLAFDGRVIEIRAVGPDRAVGTRDDIAVKIYTDEVLEGMPLSH